MTALSTHQGYFTGTNKLWLDDPNTAQLSDGSLVVQGDVLKVSWAHGGKLQQGQLKVRAIGPDLSVSWTDTWHSPQVMRFEGTVHAGLMDVLGTYSAGSGPDWGWRIQLDLRTPDRLALRMFNITPSGDESPAVELVGQR